jgi:hypothetical protein
LDRKTGPNTCLPSCRGLVEKMGERRATKAMSRGPLAYRYDPVFEVVDMREAGLRNPGDRDSRM